MCCVMFQRTDCHCSNAVRAGAVFLSGYGRRLRTCAHFSGAALLPVPSKQTVVVPKLFEKLDTGALAARPNNAAGELAAV